MTLVDNLTYTYSGNKLTSLSEAISGTPTGDIFTRGSAAAGSYTYDNNGNMLTDSRKSLQFTYNFLNLLSEVRSGSTVKAKYTWLADGSKLRVRNNSTTGFDYLGSLTYTSSSSGLTLETAQFAGGVIRSGNSQEINYFITDHLGSVRSIVNSAGTAVEQNDYYAFGAKHVRSNYAQNSNRFDFNGKEEQTTGNLKYLDYGARMYDNTIGRWFNVDPLTEEYYSFGPFTYTANNPVNAIDPDGRLIVFVNGFNPDEYSKFLFFSMAKSYNEYTDRAFLREDNYGWKNVDQLYIKGFEDSNVLYANGSYDMSSTATMRWMGGYEAGKRLIDEMNANPLKQGETIKLVGYSMGAAYAAGMAQALKNSEYAEYLELVDYIAPYQADDIWHPSGVRGRYFGSTKDWLTGGELIRNISELDQHLGDFGRNSNFGGHLLKGDLYNFLENCLMSGVTIIVK